MDSEFVVPFIFCQPSALVSTLEYEQASADPLRDCAAKIIEDMNRNHWEDIRQFCNVYAQLDLMVRSPTNIIPLKLVSLSLWSHIEEARLNMGCL